MTDKRRDHQVNVRLSRSEFLLARRGAESMKMCMSDFFRHRLVMPLTLEEERALVRFQAMREAMVAMHREMTDILSRL